MARGNQTFQKRQRENKLREKAQQKRERRQQRNIEKKQARSTDAPGNGEPVSLDDVETTGAMLDSGEEANDRADILQVAKTYEETGGTTSRADYNKGAPRVGGSAASKLFVGNIPRGVTDSNLAEFVTAAGFQVNSAVVIRDRITGDPKGFGFVELAEGEDLQEAIRGLDGQILEQKRVNVSEARPQRTGFSGSRPGGGGVGAGRRDFGRGW
jgi:cold-inducible RNA-binding protein